MGIHLKIIEERKKKKMTQDHLAEKIMVSTRTIVKWENEEVLPSLENCKKLRTVFGVTLDYLLKDSIELKSKYDECVKLGEKVLELANEDYPIDFVQNYFICSREPSMIIPKKIAEEFLKNVKEKISNMDHYDKEGYESIHHEMKDFLLFWYKYNKGKCLLSKNLKAKFLYLNSVSYTDQELEAQLNNVLVKEKPILLLRNLMIGRLIKEFNLLEYKIDDNIDEELDYDGAIMWPLDKYKP
ncbi:helix-turn-helix transcriptional regulator [Vagococcus sp. DIV0080]|uniref:Helix-turn-helix transcriptional regulator n=1 Tax=Candidatus Vagococcus giribetii TaxID=2230876 RepID=A0ABS3HQX9_9ENTE|nr:helix-turn-helix transcriptional regulator [Vagococcus sp. DIV0080]MBO0476157.1 helix-turn-helix transcriptional regulator [Vagococcus sp. DIV0080]